ncbi:hypothetical protein KIPB_006443, partial [Kipferlia bialata]|eukprot:g6443.t1
MSWRERDGGGDESSFAPSFDDSGLGSSGGDAYPSHHAMHSSSEEGDPSSDEDQEHGLPVETQTAYQSNPAGASDRHTPGYRHGEPLSKPLYEPLSKRRPAPSVPMTIPGGASLPMTADTGGHGTEGSASRVNTHPQTDTDEHGSSRVVSGPLSSVSLPTIPLLFHNGAGGGGGDQPVLGVLAPVPPSLPPALPTDPASDIWAVSRTMPPEGETATGPVTADTVSDSVTDTVTTGSGVRRVLVRRRHKSGEGSDSDEGRREAPTDAGAPTDTTAGVSAGSSRGKRARGGRISPNTESPAAFSFSDTDSDSEGPVSQTSQYDARPSHPHRNTHRRTQPPRRVTHRPPAPSHTLSTDTVRAKDGSAFDIDDFLQGNSGESEDEGFGYGRAERGYAQYSGSDSAYGEGSDTEDIEETDGDGAQERERETYGGERDRGREASRAMMDRDDAPELIPSDGGLERGHSKLFWYQQEGVQWLYSLWRQGIPGGILADDMGLGKTIQVVYTLRALFSIKAIRHALIVVPMSLLQNWRQELQIWCPSVSVFIYHGAKSKRASTMHSAMVQRASVVLTTYGTMVSDLAVLVDPKGMGGVDMGQWDRIREAMDSARQTKASKARAKRESERERERQGKDKLTVESQIKSISRVGVRAPDMGVAMPMPMPMPGMGGGMGGGGGEAGVFDIDDMDFDVGTEDVERGADAIRPPDGAYMWDMVIADEATKVKNPSYLGLPLLILLVMLYPLPPPPDAMSLTAMAIRFIAAHTRVALSGTPLQNNLQELWSLINWVSKGTVLSHLADFKRVYAVPVSKMRTKNASDTERWMGDMALRGLIQSTA